MSPGCGARRACVIHPETRSASTMLGRTGLPRHGEWGAEQSDRTIIERALAVIRVSRPSTDSG
ncbi:MAG: hypothetical protein KF876_16580 [Nitrospira sp.]|nr:hypothetical protein [Nitrospira sp.]